MNRSFRLLLLAVLGAGLLLAAAPRSASAHPMGNFTINRYSALTVGQGRVDLLYVVDMAEIPTYQELGTIRADHSTSLTPTEQDAYTAQRAADLVSNLTLTVDGVALPLALVGRPALSFPPGAGGLPTMRLELHWTAALGSATRGTLAYRDANYSERIGWKEIIARSVNGTALTQSSVPATDLSAALTQYRPEFLNNPPQATSAEIVFAPGVATTGDTAAVPQAQPLDAMAWAQSRSDALTELINQKELPLGALLIGLVAAFGLGAAHALSPGHGKTIVAAYLVGSRGTAWNAAFLGLTVTISHTIGVFVLGLIVLYASQYVLPETLYPWLGFFSGLLIAGMGVAMFWQRRNAWARTRRAAVAATPPASGTPAHDPHEYAHAPGLPHAHAAHEHDAAPQLALSHAGHDHDHDHDHALTHSYADHEHTHDHALAHSHADHDHDHGHDHVLAHSHTDHDHDHPHDHAHTRDHDDDHDALTPHKHGPFGREHTHLPADGQQVTIRSMLALGITGGIIPCPSALVVLLVAVASHRVGLGLLLIVAFSLGLACVLTGIGLLMVYGRGLLSRVRMSGAVWGRLPMASALAVSCLGMLIAFEALNAAGLLR